MVVWRGARRSASAPRPPAPAPCVAARTTPADRGGARTSALRLGRPDLVRREVDPDEIARVGDALQDRAADVAGRILELLPPGLVGVVAELEADRRRSERLTPDRELVDQRLQRRQLLAVVDEDQPEALGRRHVL